MTPTAVAILLAVLLALAVLALVLFAARTAQRIEAKLPPKGEFTDTSGGRLHYIDRGTGPTLLLIHGLAGNAHHFTYGLVDRLAKDFRVIALERPGSGYSVRPPSAAASPPAQADTVAEFIRNSKLDRPLLVGHSLGGAISLATALAHPELVSGLALVAPLTHPTDQPPPVFAPLKIRSSVVRWMLAWTLAIPFSILRREEALATIFAPEPVPDDFATAGGGLLGLRPSAFVSASKDLVSAPEGMPGMLERYGELRMPIGILFGTGDRVLDHQVHGNGMAERVPHLKLELVDGGHMLPLTAVDRVDAFVRSVAQSTFAEESKR